MRLKEKYIAAVLRHPWLVIIATLTIAISSSYGMQHLIVDAGVDALIGDTYQSKIEHKKVLDDFTESTNLQILIVGNEEPLADQGNGQIFTQQGLSLLRELTDEAWQIPYVGRVDSITNYQHTEADGDDLVVAALVPLASDVDTDVVQKTKHVALSEPQLSGQLVAVNGNIAIINIEFNIPDSDKRANIYREVMQFVDSWLTPYRKDNANFNFRYSGDLAFDAAAVTYVEKDGITLVPLMLLFIVIILRLLLRSSLITMAAAVVVVITGTTSLGILGWLGVKLDTMSYIAPIVIMTLAVADVVHLSLGVVAGKQQGNNTKLDAISYSMDINIWPIFLTSLTTALGVITFSLSEYPSLRNLGLAIAIGVIVAFVLTLTLLPALLVKLKVVFAKPYSFIFFHSFANWIINHYRKILLLGGVVCLFFVISASKNILNDSPELLFEKATPERQVVELLKSEMNGIMRFDVAIYSHESSGAMQAEFLRDVVEFKGWLQAQQGVEHANSITDTIKRLNKSMHANSEEYYRLPESQNLIAQYLLLYELSLPYGLDLSNQLNYDKSATRLAVSTKGLYAAGTIDLKQQIINWFAERNPDVKVAFAGYSLVMQELAIKHLMPSLAKGGAIAFLLIAFILMLVFKDWRYGFVCVCANLVPVAMGYGVWAYINGLANFAVMCVAGVCLGVVIDFAVHFLSKYRFARQQNKMPDDAVRYAFEKVAVPIFVTTIVLAGGFWILTLSSISLNAGMGLLTGIIIVLAFMFDLIVLPAMLLWSERKLIK